MSPHGTGRRPRIGIVASRLHRTGPDAALFRLLRPLEEATRDELQPALQVVGQTHDAHDRCQRIVFFEDPHVAREHEADIQLLERSARIATERTMCVSDRASAQVWIRNRERRMFDAFEA